MQKKLVLGHTFRLPGHFGRQMIVHQYKVLFVERHVRLSFIIKLIAPNIITILDRCSEQDILQLIILIKSFHIHGKMKIFMCSWQT
jgi:hypothetical protein